MRHQPPIRPRRIRSRTLPALLCAALAGGLGLGRPVSTAAAEPETIVLDSFDAPAAWVATTGAATVTSVTDGVAGRTALRVSDIVGDGRLELAPTTGPNEIQGLPRELTIDVRGTTTWRPLYLQLRDATGEIFHHRLGHVAGEWETRRIDLRSKPATTIWGDRDGVLDLPVSFFKVVLDPRPEGAANHVDLELDNLRLVVDPWVPLKLAKRRIQGYAGEGTSASMTLAAGTPFRVTLRDELDRIRTWAGTTPATGPARLTWSGRADDATMMSGAVQARIRVGPEDDVRTYDVPWLGSVLARRAVDPKSMVGINTFLSEPDPHRRKYIEWQGRRLEDARVAMMRETFVWNRIEPRRGWFEWAKFDQAVEVAEAHGVEVLGVLAFSALWASSAPATETDARAVLYAPSDLADWAAYVEAVVGRYGDRIDAWEIWNEPNHPKFWLPAPNPEAYAQLLAVAAEVIRREDPGATILLGGITGTDVRYLDRLRAAGAWDDFDVLALHGFVKLTPEASGLGGWFDSAIAYVQRWGVKPVWMTEICWPVSAAEPGIPAVTTSTQAAYLGRTFTRAAEAGVARVFWYTLVDHDSGAGSRYDATCGLFDVQQQARPSFKALKVVGAAFEGAVSAGSFDPAALSRRAVSAGDAGWTAAAGGTVSTLASGLSATYKLESRTDEVNYYASVRLPGAPTSLSFTLSGDGSANSILAELTDATGERCSVSMARLRAGSRVIRVALDGTGANWSCWGGDGDRRLDATPIRLRNVSVHPTGIGPLSGSFRLTNLAVGEGPVDRGLVLARGSSLVLLAWRGRAATATTTTIQLPGSSAFELVDGKRVPLTVTSGKLVLGLGAQLRAVDVPIALTHGTIAPAEWTWLRWIAGDGMNARPQVIGPDGQWVRTDVSKVYPAGLRSIAWDGRATTSSGTRVPVPEGTYVLRLVVTAPDGRVGTIQGSVRVRWP